MACKTKVLIVDDHAIVQEGITKALEMEEGFEILGTAANGQQALEQIKTLQPHVVILDIAMPGMNGVKATQAIKEHDAAIRIVIFTMYSDKEYVVSLFNRGISGYVLKCEPVSELVNALKAARSGGSYFSETIRKSLEDYIKELEKDTKSKDGERSAIADTADGISSLSAREKEIFILLADGLKPKEIGTRLFISPKTVETHKYNIMEKLGVDSVTDLTKLAIRNNLIEPYENS